MSDAPGTAEAGAGGGGLAGRVVIVTGGGRGLGRAYVEALATCGARVVVNDLSVERANDVVDAVTAEGGQGVAAVHSVSAPDGARAIVDTATEAFGTVDAVINNAGFLRNGYFEDLRPETLDAMLDVHVRGAFLVTQAAWPVMREQGYGRVVLTGSSGGMFAMHGQANYAAAKAGVYGLGRALALEGREHGILVNTLLPMATTLIGVDDPVPDYVEHAGYTSEMTKVLSDRRTPEAVAPMACFLASELCRLTGETFSAAGGRFSRVFVGLTQGWLASSGETLGPRDIADHLEEITDLASFDVPESIYDEVRGLAIALGASRPEHR